MQSASQPVMCINPSHRNANLLQISLVEMPSFSFNINVYGGDITFLPGVEKWINWFIETRVLRPYVLPERLTVPVKFLYDPTLEVTIAAVAQNMFCELHYNHCKMDSEKCCHCQWLLLMLFVDCHHHIVIVVIVIITMIVVGIIIIIIISISFMRCSWTVVVSLFMH